MVKQIHTMEKAIKISKLREFINSRISELKSMDDETMNKVARSAVIGENQRMLRMIDVLEKAQDQEYQQHLENVYGDGDLKWFIESHQINRKPTRSQKKKAKTGVFIKQNCCNGNDPENCICLMG